MASDMTPATLRSIQRLTGSASMAAVARNLETQLRNGVTPNVGAFATSYYPMGFVTGPRVSVSVLQWLFPSPEATVDPSRVESPLDELSQIFLITNCLLPRLSAAGHHEALDVLLRANAFLADGNETKTDSKRQQALDDALRYAKDGDTINMFIAHGADPQAVKRGFLTPPVRRDGDTRWFTTASFYTENGVFLVGDDTLLADHLDWFCSPDHVRGLLHAGVDAVRALPIAAKHRRVDALRAMVESGPVDLDFRATAQNRSTALIEAVCSKDQQRRAPSRLQVVGALIRLGVDVNARGQNNDTALGRAVNRSHESIIELLLQRGADPNLCDDDGRSPMHLLSCNAWSHPRLELLLQHGADPNLRDTTGKTPLHVLACQQISKWVLASIKTLITSGADISILDNTGGSALTKLSQDIEGKKLVQELRASGLIAC